MNKEKALKVANDVECAAGWWWLGIGSAVWSLGAAMEFSGSCEPTDPCPEASSYIGELLNNAPDFWAFWTTFFVACVIAYASAELCASD